jgi:hypothetical protein
MPEQEPGPAGPYQAPRDRSVLHDIQDLAAKLASPLKLSPESRPPRLGTNPLFTPSRYALPMTYSRDTTAISELTVSTWSEE